MNTYQITDFGDFLHRVFHTFQAGDDVIVSSTVITEILSEDNTESYRMGPLEVSVEKQTLYRGHSRKEWKLVPALGRKSSTEIKEEDQIKNEESEILQNFKRRRSLLNSKLENDLDILIYAQHFGLATRLLDWTTNPLVALFFACSDEPDKDGAVHMIFNDLKKTEVPAEPLESDKIVIFPPALNNDRIVAQNGWFTIHPYSMSKDENNTVIQNSTTFEIPSHLKKQFMRRLDTLGINFESIFPGVEGTCKYINWKVLQG